MTALIATFTTTGASVTVGATTQTSGTTANDFSAPVTYTVHAQDGSTQDYTVTVTPADYCGALPPPTGGSVSVSNSGFVPSTATYTCNAGRLINPTGGEQRTCAAANTWTPAAPTCDLSFMVMKVGDGNGALSSASAQVVVEERRVSDGAVGRTIAMPIAATGPQNQLTVAGSASSDGQLSLSDDGRFVTFGGYYTVTGTASVATTSTASVPRVVGRISASGAVDTSTMLVDSFSGHNLRGVTSVDGSAFWAVGNQAADGVQYVMLGSTGSSLQIATPTAGPRGVNIFGGQLYWYGQNTFSKVGSGAPTTAGQILGTATTLPSAGGIAMVDLDPIVPGFDTLYVASDATVSTSGVLGLKKFKFDGTTWTQVTAFVPSVSGSGVALRTVAAIPDGSVVHLVVTTTATNNVLMTVDDNGTNMTPMATSLSAGAAGTNYVFRGLAQSPYTP